MVILVCKDNNGNELFRREMSSNFEYYTFIEDCKKFNGKMGWVIK